MTSLSARADSLLALHHRSTPVVLPTVWDAWSAQAAVSAGFEALTVGSHPVANSVGAGDGEDMSLEDALAGIARVARAVDVPVSADVESGYDTAAGELVERVLEAGAVGVNIEDTVHSEGRLRGAQEHADYIAGVRQAADAAGAHLVINGRTDVFKTDEQIPDRQAEAITRLNLLEGAGADSLYPVGLPDVATLKALLAAVSAPLNVTAHPVNGSIPEGLDLARLTELGVRRVSFGPLLQAALADHLDEITKAWR
ncbi:isocitrate lyase/PEP mutase family protein [Brachybacterium alimentarium]|uniref:isocitrate lyase/PEP mutase family protein n=1 Tax=Brachybacterium alimentarium TaxID=47845 RepID=UPI000DF35D69|nr:isocitrate lyase/phosphoenolpyruvate mutase family protein [Brachybacterium alimentarium]MDN5822383.1 isocitrate lyase/phosphoenolpyruvate mutase family protein [Brachybacterium sp.]RCS60642.1 isocitrate lyase/phosphoenolpyruvate mutase family protein [Brachybacterium alimentarium]RCS75047.1 isocitrate lyase/phosphoenolpyruvate mutase family protein [Brachybacterium alimentarium]RCS80222.1 isocitrate lyase/phosphoenolpyruvate mutase family protein [Brachybacterium alimentarium]RCS88352.1 is